LTIVDVINSRYSPVKSNPRVDPCTVTVGDKDTAVVGAAVGLG
jgi:hypothetical protein